MIKINSKFVQEISSLWISCTHMSDVRFMTSTFHMLPFDNLPSTSLAQNKSLDPYGNILCTEELKNSAATPCLSLGLVLPQCYSSLKCNEHNTNFYRSLGAVNESQ